MNFAGILIYIYMGPKSIPVKNSNCCRSKKYSDQQKELTAHTCATQKQHKMTHKMMFFAVTS